jgi:hypothetical protein
MKLIFTRSRKSIVVDIWTGIEPPELQRNGTWKPRDESKTWIIAQFAVDYLNDLLGISLGEEQIRTVECRGLMFDRRV